MRGQKKKAYFLDLFALEGTSISTPQGRLNILGGTIFAQRAASTGPSDLTRQTFTKRAISALAWRKEQPCSNVFFALTS